MRKFGILICFCIGLIIPQYSFAILSMELTRGVAGAVPIVISPFENESSSQNLTDVISNDLKNSGRFKVYNQSSNTGQTSYFKSVGAENLVTGKVRALGDNRYQVNLEVYDLFKGQNPTGLPKPVISQSFVVPTDRLRALAHHISDMVYQHVLGVRGIFSTRLAYVLVQRNGNQPTKYILEVSDQDGYNPRALLNSPEPIMSPAWSPNGKHIAYVSFENKRPSIFIQDVSSGARDKVSSFKGINGAPAWSPDGRKLALVLSKEGSPNIYVLNLGDRSLTKLTNDWGINTEPAWSPDGKSIVFTSNRSGGPQIYQKNLLSGAVTRITYDGNYNARASFAAEGNRLVMLNRQDSLFNIGILDLDNGVLRVLTSSSGSDNESPSVAPNGSMVLYGTIYGGRSILAMAATDGSVQIRLPARNGEVQDPAWSPFLG